MPVDAFISYAHADEEHLETLRTHLSLLRRQGSGTFVASSRVAVSPAPLVVIRRAILEKRRGAQIDTQGGIFRLIHDSR